MQESEARAIAEQLGAQLKAMREAGLDAAEIGSILTARTKAKGLNVEVRVIPVLPGLDALEVKLPVDEAAQLATPVSSTKAEDCPHPHTPCPVCQADVCFMGKQPPVPHGVCAHCASFLLTTPGDPPQVSLLTEEQLLALPDDDRITLQRIRRLVEKRRATRSPL